MSKTDNDKLDQDNSATEIQDHTDQDSDQVEVDYGILVFVDTNGHQDIQIIGKDRASLHDLLGLIHVAERKISTIWDSQNDPVVQALQRDVNELRMLSTKNTQAMGAIIEVLTGVRAGLELLNESIVTSQPDKE